MPKHHSKYAYRGKELCLREFKAVPRSGGKWSVGYSNARERGPCVHLIGKRMVHRFGLNMTAKK